MKKVLGRFAMMYLPHDWGKRDEMFKSALKLRYGARRFGKKCSSYMKR